MCIVVSWLLIIFFLSKQKPANVLRISDWSSDVCSSYLPGSLTAQLPAGRGTGGQTTAGARGVRSGQGRSGRGQGTCRFGRDPPGQIHDQGTVRRRNRPATGVAGRLRARDRKSTRLNSSH